MHVHPDSRLSHDPINCVYTIWKSQRSLRGIHQEQMALWRSGGGYAADGARHVPSSATRLASEDIGSSAHNRQWPTTTTTGRDRQPHAASMASTSTPATQHRASPVYRAVLYPSIDGEELEETSGAETTPSANVQHNPYVMQHHPSC